MDNVGIERDGDKLRITVDMSRVLGPSKSGKTTIIATTGGNVQLDTGEFVGLNIYRKTGG